MFYHINDLHILCLTVEFILYLWNSVKLFYSLKGRGDSSLCELKGDINQTGETCRAKINPLPLIETTKIAYNPIYETGFHTSSIRSLDTIYSQQECIPVGCVPPASGGVSGGVCVGCILGGVCVSGVCVQEVCVCPEGRIPQGLRGRNTLSPTPPPPTPVDRMNATRL